ncbi:MAG TPA: bifunctional diaminohydroxyphosphoribosylaminopyrimidine deaminase/5-amino-6-(5-phosphoribosylamino)uracil reductase RibD [bacterium]|nr:bifunctional diaminohydroxyphosphoribosylaminopyrimidine deaminase/5-amino-6-(5-phosphoribosylamino)uracil reductase RibD [bacterium]
MAADLDILHPDDVGYLRRALALAAHEVGRTSPNPMVGCVLVKNGEVVGEGAHRYDRIGHAEVVALKAAGRAAAGSTAYVSLEPCSHQGRTPPCTEALIAAHVSKVVACMKDPDPRVSGAGFDRLLMAGTIIRWGLLKEEATHLNRAFIKARTQGLPYVTIKIATSADGKIATATGDSRGLSSRESSFLVHQLRATVDAIVIGAGTLVADNPWLTTRWEEYADAAGPLPPGIIPYPAGEPRTPLRVVISANLAFEPAKYRLFQTARELPVLVVTKRSAPKPALKTLEALGVQLAFVPATRTGLDLKAALEAILAAGKNHLLVEGGGRLLGAVLDGELWDELVVIQSPRLIGGAEAPGWAMGRGVRKIAQAPVLQRTDLLEVGGDVVQRYGQGSAV